MGMALYYPALRTTNSIIPNQDYNESEVGTIISAQMSDRHLNQPSVYGGYAILAGNAVHEVWDISDPYNPQFLAEMVSQYANGEAESHQVSYGRDDLGNTWLATTSGKGIDIWNLTDPVNPIYETAFTLPGINYGDVSNAIWGICWQGDYIYAGATTFGIYIIDVTDIQNPVLVKTISRTELGGVVAGPLFAIGNLLVVTTPKGNAGIATLDISQPTVPVLLDSYTSSKKSYIGGFYGKNATLINPLRVFDVTSDPQNINLFYTDTIPKSEYVSFGDNHLFLGGLRGGTEGIYKYNIQNFSDPHLVLRIPGRNTRWDDQFSCPVGNLLIICDDQKVNNQYVGGVIAVHQVEKDLEAPKVIYVNPINGAENQAPTTRIGISFSDWIEFSKVDVNSFIVRPVGGEPIKGRWGSTYTTLNFDPEEELLPFTTYEVILTAGGITDLVGNELEETFISTFTTGNGSIPQISGELAPIVPTKLGDTTYWQMLSPDTNYHYIWETADGNELIGTTPSHKYEAPGRYPVRLKVHELITTNGENKIYEAEEAELSGGVRVASQHEGFTGSGYADYPGGMGSEVKITWKVTLSTSQTTKLSFAYANGGDFSRPLNLVVNGGTPREVLFTPTGGWKKWEIQERENFDLNAGENTIELVATAGTVGPNIDHLSIPSNDSQEVVVGNLIGSISFIQRVYQPLTPQTPLNSQTIILNGENIWTVNPDANTVSVVSQNELEKIAEIEVGDHPIGLDITANGNVWVLNRDSWNISVLEGSTFSSTQIIPLPYASQPVSILFDHSKNYAYISLQATAQILKLDIDIGETVDILDLEEDENGLMPQLGGLALEADEQLLYVSRFISNGKEGEIYEINLENFELEKIITLAHDAGPDGTQNSRGIPNYLKNLVISPDGTALWTPSKKDNIQRGGYRDGNSLTHDQTVRSIVSYIDLDPKSEDIQKRIDFDNSDRGHQAVFNDLGDLLFITLPSNNEVVIIDVYEGKELARLITAHTPEGCFIDDATGQLYVHNFLSRSLSVFDIRPLISGEGLAKLIDHIPLVSQEPLSPAVLKGKQLFYNASSLKLNASGYMSCASCHLDGTHDGNTWDMTSLGEGLRNTIDLRGRAGTTHGRLHWTANFDEVHDFENQIRLLGDGIGLMNDEDFLETHSTLGKSKEGLSEDLDHLSAYVSSLDQFPPSPFRNQDGTLTEDAEFGKIIFQQQGCANCHSGSIFTDSPSGVLHDIGTNESSSGSRLDKILPGFDTPTLRGIWQTAPYLHDGSANTLEEVFLNRNPNDAHAIISDLSADDFDKLISYLKQIDGQASDASSSSFSLQLNIGEINTEFIPLSFESNLPNITKAIYFLNGTPVDTIKESPFETVLTQFGGGTHEVMVKVLYKNGLVGMVSPPETFFVDFPLNIKKPTSSELMSFYPNPLTRGEYLNIAFDLPRSQYVQVSIWSISGKLVYQKVIFVKEKDPKFKIEPFALTSGTFLLNIKGDSWGIRKKLLVL